MTIKIGISGKQGTGKSTLAQELLSALNKNQTTVKITPLAGTIKEIERLASIGDWVGVESIYRGLMAPLNLSITLNEIVEEVKVAYKKYPSQDGVKNRKFLQIIGTELGRDLLGEDIWIDYLFNTLDLDLEVAIIDDVRMENEASRMDYLIHLDHELALDEWIEVCKKKGYNWQDQHVTERGNVKQYANWIVKPYDEQSKQAAIRCIQELCNMSDPLETLLEKEKEVVDFLKFGIDNLFNLAHETFPIGSVISYDGNRTGVVRDLFIEVDGSVVIIVDEIGGDTYPINLSYNPRKV